MARAGAFLCWEFAELRAAFSENRKGNGKLWHPIGHERGYGRQEQLVVFVCPCGKAGSGFEFLFVN